MKIRLRLIMKINSEDAFVFFEIISYYDDEKCAATEKCAEIFKLLLTKIFLCIRLKFYPVFD